MRTSLNQALQIVKGFAEKRGRLPILSTVLIEQKLGELTLTATDLESSIRFSLAYDRFDENEWRACVPVHVLADLIKEQGGEPVLSPGESFRLNIESAEGTRTLAGQDPEDFPVWEDPGPEDYVMIPVDTFLDLESLPKTASKSDSRLNLNTVSFAAEVYGEGVATACDGHRINSRKVRWLPQPWRFMLPADVLKKAVAAVKKLRKQIDDVELFRSEKSLNIIAGPVSIKIRFKDGEYADIGTIHRPSGPEAQFRTDWFVTALKRMKPMTSAHDRGITLHFRERELELWSYLPEIGAGFTTIGGKVDPELVGTKMVFNVEYLLNAARKCNGSVKIVSNEYERSPWGFGPEEIMPFASDRNGYQDRIERPSMAPPLAGEEKFRRVVLTERPAYRKRAALVVRDVPRAEPTESWRTDRKADPGDGWKWEHESPYFPAHWARVA